MGRGRGPFGHKSSELETKRLEADVVEKLRHRWRGQWPWQVDGLVPSHPGRANPRSIGSTSSGHSGVAHAGTQTTSPTAPLPGSVAWREASLQPFWGCLGGCAGNFSDRTACWKCGLARGVPGGKGGAGAPLAGALASRAAPPRGRAETAVPSGRDPLDGLDANALPPGASRAFCWSWSPNSTDIPATQAAQVCAAELERLHREALAATPAPVESLVR